MRDSRRPSVLLVAVWAQKGGAERIVLDLLDRLACTFRVTLGFVRTLPRDEGTLEWDGATVGLREVLFGQWDVIHTHLFLPGLLVRMRRAWDGSFRWVHTVHYDDYDSLRWGRLKRWLDFHVVFPSADVLVAVSEPDLERLRRFPGARLVENAIPLDPPRPSALGGTIPGAPTPGPVIGTVAHLRREKGVEDLIRAFARLREAHPGARLRVAGQGPRKPAVEALIRRLGLGEAVEMQGFVHDLDAFYAGLDVYVQPSRSERFGLAVLDAFRFGLPVVAAGVGFLPELLGGGRFGVVVPREGAGDFEDRLAEEMERVVSDPGPHRERTRAGLEHWRRRLDPEAMAAGYGKAYLDALLPRICMIQPIVTHGYGGVARQLLLQTRELAARGHRVFLVQRSDPRLTTDAEVGERWRHVEIRGTGRLGGGEAGSRGAAARLRGIAFLTAGLVRLWELRNRIDVLHAHQLHSPTLLGVLGKRLLVKPLVTKVTSSGELGESAEVDRLPLSGLRRRLFQDVDRVLVLTDAMAEEMVALGFSPGVLRLVPNAVEIPHEAPPRPSDGPFRVLYTGRLSTEKRLDVLLEAVRLLARRGRTIEVDLVGAGDPARDATAALREAAASLPEGARVRFHGYREDVDRFYEEAQAFVLPSSTEGLSNALLEAMARGLPCVVSDIPPNRFAVGDAALRFTVGSAPRLAEELDRLIRDAEGAGRSDGERAGRGDGGVAKPGDGEGAEPGGSEGAGRGGDRPGAARAPDAPGGGLARRLGAAARRRVRERFSVEAVVDRLEDVYREVADAHPRPKQGGSA